MLVLAVQSGIFAILGGISSGHVDVGCSGVVSEANPSP